MTSCTPPPVDDDPAYTALLEADAMARQCLQVAQGQLNPSAMTNAERAVYDSTGDVLVYELRGAADWLRGLRWAHRHNPQAVRAALAEAIGLDVLRIDVQQLRTDADELAEAVAALEGQR